MAGASAKANASIRKQRRVDRDFSSGGPGPRQVARVACDLRACGDSVSARPTISLQAVIVIEERCAWCISSRRISSAAAKSVRSGMP